MHFSEQFVLTYGYKIKQTQMPKTTTLVLLLLLPIFLFSQANWELKKDEDGIQVFWREAADSDIKEIKIVFDVDASLNSIAALMSDVDNYTTWVYATSHADLTKDLGNNTMIYYNIVDFPWPLDDRDLYLHTTLTQNSQTKILTSLSYAMPDYRDDTEEMVRIKKADIVWTVTPLSTQKAKIEYSLLTDPGGSLPAFLINIASDYGPFKTMQIFREQLALPRYRDALYPNIEELQLTEKK